MIVIMVCATAINFGLYNVFSSYFGSGSNSDNTNKVLTNMFTTVAIISIVTVIMIVLIPKEAVHEAMDKIQNGHGNNGNGMLSLNGGSGNDIDEDGDGINDLEEQQLSDMIDYDFESESSGNNKK